MSISQIVKQSGYSEKTLRNYFYKGLHTFSMRSKVENLISYECNAYFLFIGCLTIQESLADIVVL